MKQSIRKPMFLVRDAADEQHNGAIQSDAVARAKCGAVAARELVEVQARRDRLDPPRDAVALEHVGQLARRRDDGVDGVALPARERARERACDRCRQQRQVVMQILFEERVIGLDDGDLQLARGLDADPVRDERRLHMQHIDPAREL
jgi:hypothetical protein